MRAVRVRLLIAAQLLCGCTTVSVSRYQTAKPIPKGESQLIGGVSMPKSAGHGIDRGTGAPGTVPTEPAAGDPVRVHHGILNAADATWNYGLTNRIQTSVQLQLWGLKTGVRATLLDTRLLKMAVGAYGGATWGFYNKVDPDGGSQGGRLETAGTAAAQYFDFPLTVSVHANDRVAVLFGATATRVSAWGRLTDRDHDTEQVSDPYSRSATFWQPGGFFGFAIGSRVQVVPGIAWFREPIRHPVRNWRGGSLFAYPYVGFVVNPGPKRKKPRTPAFDPLAPKPVPEATPEPTPEATPAATPAPTPEPTRTPTP